MIIMDVNNEEYEKYIEKVESLHIMDTQNKIISLYMRTRMLAEYANHVYRNSNEKTNLVLTDEDYDKLIKLLERIESDFPNMKTFFNEIYGMDSLTERVG